MREIKFRVWHKPEKKMHSYLKAKFGKATNITLEGKFKDVEQITTKTVPNDDLEVMQFTGLKDKNGTPIFESDIVRFTEKGNEIIAEIVWKDREALFAIKTKFGWGSFALQDEKDIKVIGNIYENPNLLK
jgi:uncharacterized phage protein (TIGR01671 family)